MTDFDRIFNRVAGYWPGYRMTRQAQLAWRQKLDGIDTQQVINALDEFSDEDLPTPPRAGQLKARISPPQKRGNTETEIERVRRQRAEATQLVKDGKMSQADFDFYAEDYWNPVEAAHSKAA